MLLFSARRMQSGGCPSRQQEARERRAVDTLMVLNPLWLVMSRDCSDLRLTERRYLTRSSQKQHPTSCKYGTLYFEEKQSTQKWGWGWFARELECFEDLLFGDWISMRKKKKE